MRRYVTTDSRVRALMPYSSLISGQHFSLDMLAQLTMSASRSYITRSMPGTFAGKRIAALIPAIPAPTTTTFIFGFTSMGCSSSSSGCHVIFSFVAGSVETGWESELPMLQVVCWFNTDFRGHFTKVALLLLGARKDIFVLGNVLE